MSSRRNKRKTFVANALRASTRSSVLDPIKDVGPAIKGLAAAKMGLQHGPGALTHGSERLH